MTLSGPRIPNRTSAWRVGGKISEPISVDFISCSRSTTVGSGQRFRLL
jgi:hypothetical protein